MLAIVAAVIAASTEKPDWIERGSRALKEGGARTVMGVGTISGVRNAALARRAAENRAGIEVARILENLVASVVEPVGSAVLPPPSAESPAQPLPRSLYSQCGPAAPVDHWVAPDGSSFVLVRLDFDACLQKLGERQRKRLARAFDQVAKE